MGRVDLHRTVFQDGEELLVLPDALLAEEDRARIADDDAQADDDPEGYQHDDADAGQDDVDEAFKKMLVHDSIQFSKNHEWTRINTKFYSNHRIHGLHRSYNQCLADVGQSSAEFIDNMWILFKEESKWPTSARRLSCHLAWSYGCFAELFARGMAPAE